MGEQTTRTHRLGKRTAKPVDRRTAPFFLAVLAVAMAVGTGGGVALAAGTGYGSLPPAAPSGTPGGFAQVVTSVTVPAHDALPTTVRVSVDGSRVLLQIPPDAFATSVQMVVTAPVLGAITGALSSLGFPGDRALAGLGVSVVAPGNHPYSGTFLAPLTVTVSSAAIAPADRVVQWSAAGVFRTEASAHISAGAATWAFQTDPAFAVIGPQSVVPGATAPVTGIPALPDLGFGAGLMALGVGLWRWEAHRG